MDEEPHESESQDPQVVGYSPSPGSTIPSHVPDYQEIISRASGSRTKTNSHHPTGKTSPILLGEHPHNDGKSTDKGLVVLTDLRYDPLYGNTIARLQDTELTPGDTTSSGKTLRSSIDLPSTQGPSERETAVLADRKRENLRTFQQSDMEDLDLIGTVHLADRSRRASGETGMSPEVSQSDADLWRLRYN